MRFARENARAWRASAMAAASVAVAAGLAGAPAAATAASGEPIAVPRATYIGAFAATAGTVGQPRADDWNAAYQEIGPLQSDKIFYSIGAPKPPVLPPTFKNSICADLKHQPVCVIAYKTASKKTLQSFVESMPSHRSAPVIMVYWAEPELAKSGISASTFKKNFDLRSQWVRQAARNRGLTYVKVAMNSATSGYMPGGPGFGCAYLPAASNVDYYLADVYEFRLTGLKNKADFQRWSLCAKQKHKPLGLAEYGLGVCTNSGAPATELEREQTLTADATYLAANFPHLLLWEYWWSTITGNSNNKCAHTKFPANSVTATKWKKIEADIIGS